MVETAEHMVLSGPYDRLTAELHGPNEMSERGIPEAQLMRSTDRQHTWQFVQRIGISQGSPDARIDLEL